MGFVASRGVKNSLLFAGVLTVVEILGLLVIVGAGLANQPNMLSKVPDAFPPLSDTAALTGVLSASLVAFFAFIGFDDVVNMVEETNPDTPCRAPILFFGGCDGHLLFGGVCRSQFCSFDNAIRSRRRWASCLKS